MDVFTQIFFFNRQGISTKNIHNALFQVRDALGFKQSPDVTRVLQQLKSIVHSYNLTDKAVFLHHLQYIYEFLRQQHLGAAMVTKLQEVGLVEWIWHGDGFVATANTVLHRELLDLTPYVYYIPTEMQIFGALFESCGVARAISLDTMIQVNFAIRVYKSILFAHNRQLIDFYAYGNRQTLLVGSSRHTSSASSCFRS